MSRRSTRSSTKKPPYDPSVQSDNEILLRRKTWQLRTGQLSYESDGAYLAYQTEALQRRGIPKKNTRSSRKADQEKAKKASARKSQAKATKRTIALKTPKKPQALSPVSSAPEESPEHAFAESKQDYGTPSLLNGDGFNFSPAIAANNDNAPLPPPPPSSNYPGVSLSEEGMVRNVVAAQVNLLVNKKISGLKLKHLLSKHIDLDKYPLNLILSAM